MLSEILLEIYERDLNRLKSEIQLYSNEADLWKIDGDILNSAGNLCLHLTGNLKHFFGAVLGQTGYVRDRDREFADHGVPRAQMLADIDEAFEIIKKVLNRLSDADFAGNYPIEVFGKPMTTGFFL